MSLTWISADNPLDFAGDLGQADSGKGGNRIDCGCDVRVVGTVRRPIDDVAADEIAF